MAQYGPLSFRVGMTKTKRKRLSGSSTSGNNRGKAAKLVTYCPICPLDNVVRPEKHPHATVSQFAKNASCNRGHTWNVLN